MTYFQRQSLLLKIRLLKKSSPLLVDYLKKSGGKGAGDAREMTAVRRFRTCLLAPARWLIRRAKLLILPPLCGLLTRIWLKSVLRRLANR